MKRVALIGLGLMGASLGLALKRRAAGVAVAAYARRPETRRQALAGGVADEVFATPAEAVRNADIVVLCTPVLTMADLARACLPGLKHGCLMTDVGSTKAGLMAAIPPLLKRRAAVFIGSHPMAGSEQTGLEAGRADLYEGCMVALTPARGTPVRAVARLRRFWRAVGGRPLVLAAAAHDRLVARTSHLPHLIAAALVQCVGRDRPAHLIDFCGPGFRDTTRVASGSPEVWHDILKTNHRAVQAELRAFQRDLRQLNRLLTRVDFAAIRRFLDDNRTTRNNLVRPAAQR